MTRGIAPERIVLSGDSAGGALAVAVALALRDRGRPGPGALVLVSPWVDLAARVVDRGEDYLLPELMARFADHYLQGAPATHPLASPAHADLPGLPPMLIQAGGVEVLRGQIEAFARKAREAGVDVRLEVWDGMFHAWHGFPLIVPQARAAFGSIGRWVDARAAA